MRIELSEVINQPIDQVFAVLSDPSKHKEWVQEVLDDSSQSPGPTHEGTTFHEDGKLLGRKLGENWTVTRFEAPHTYEQSAQLGPAHVSISFTLTPSGDGTRVDLITEGETGGIFKISDSIVARVLKNQQQTDLDNLKLILENGGTSTGSES